MGWQQACKLVFGVSFAGLAVHYSIDKNHVLAEESQINQEIIDKENRYELKTNSE